MSLRVDFYLVGQGDALVALPPLAAAAMVAAGNTLGVGIMLSLLSAMSMLCVVAMTESSKNVMNADAEMTEDLTLATEVP